MHDLANEIMLEATDHARKLWPNYSFPPFSDHQAPSIGSWPVGLPEETIDPDDFISKVQQIRNTNPESSQAVVSRLNGTMGPGSIQDQ